MDQQLTTDFAPYSGVAAPYLHNDVAIDYIAMPFPGGHQHETSGHTIIRNTHPVNARPVLPRDQLLHAFATERFLPDGRENPQFVLNKPQYRDASILLAGRNFGLGGTQSAAAIRLLSCGIMAVIAPSFGTVFMDECLQAGLLPVELEASQLAVIAEHVSFAPRLKLNIDLQKQIIYRQDLEPVSLNMPKHLRRRFIQGLSDRDETIPYTEHADAFVKKQKARQPWIYQ